MKVIRNFLVGRSRLNGFLNKCYLFLSYSFEKYLSNLVYYWPDSVHFIVRTSVFRRFHKIAKSDH